MGENVAVGENPDWVATRDGVVLVGGQCAECGRRFFPAKRNCPGCGGEAVGKEHLARTGRLYTYSTISVAPADFKVPYTVGYVDLDDGVRIFGQIDEDPADLALDCLMEPVLGTIRVSKGSPVEGYKFRRAQNVS